MKSKIVLTIATSTLMFSVSCQPVYAAPGSLSQLPLFIAPTPPANIFFALDDSGSMGWTMPANDTTSISLYYYFSPNRSDYLSGEWPAWCRGANVLAYDPAIEYKPWKGKDPNGNAFQDVTDLTKVPVNPAVIDNLPADRWTWWPGLVLGTATGIIDLSNAPVFKTWSDSNGNGIFDPNECPTNFGSDVIKAKNLSAAEKINFANWFAYYRTRMHTTKAAVTNVVAVSSARMGMATLHHNNHVGIEIKDMSSISNKDALMTDLLAMYPSGGTPLRSFLNDVGQYFDNSSTTPSSLNLGSSPTKPIFPQTQGGECQQNFVMLMTDGFWNGSNPGVGHQDKTVDNINVFEAHKDSVSETLADVAMKWYKTDLAPSLSGKVPTQSGASSLNLDENSEQHLVTFGVAFGPVGTLSNDPTDRNAPFSWPTPSPNADTTVDDLRHAAYNGRGQFLSARDPSSLVSALETVISDIEARQGSAASVAFNSTSLGTNTLLFFARFNTANWSGDLLAWNLDANTGQLTTLRWQAASILDSRTDADMANRVVYTWGDAGSSNDGVLFDWWDGTAPDPATGIKNDLLRNPDGSNDTSPFTKTQARVDFLRGDTTNEGKTLRDRGSRLGDIIHSSPQFVGKPASGWPDNDPFGSASARYSSYQSALNTTPRDEVVYVGANDGMLHGFKVSDGNEVLAYTPSAPANTLNNTGLHYLSELDYNHRYYVDGTPEAADVFIKTTSTGTPSWHTILVGSLRGGGRGLYALDVTDPTSFANTETAAQNTVLWEFTDANDADLGYTFSTPQIAMMNNNKWAVIVGNGYNSSGTYTAKLMIIYIEAGVDGTWSPSDYVELDTGVGTSTNPNGLSTPSLLDLDGNGTIDRIYAGDLYGNLWTFDVEPGSDWENAYASNSTQPKLLFSAGTSKPITMKPLLLKPDWIPDSANNSPNVMVYFGTGQYIATSDPSNTATQTFYGIWDTGVQVSSSNLVEQTFLTSSDPTVRILTQNPVSFKEPPSLGDLGWFINLPESGERVVVDAFEVENVVFFNTLVPQSAPCSAGGGSWLMSVDAKTGGSPTTPAFDFNGDDDISDADKLNGKTLAGQKFSFGIASASAVLGNTQGKNYQYTSGTDSNKPLRRKIIGGAGPAPSGKRLSWIELVD